MRAERTVVVGRTEARIERVLGETEGQVVGYVSPAREQSADTVPSRATAGVTARADGGTVLDTRLGGVRRLVDLSELPVIFERHGIERAILAFSAPDRTDFFGALAACRDHRVSVATSRECADSVLVNESNGTVVEIDLEPWSPSSRAIKCLFDKAFALVGLLLSIPILAFIAVAIKLDSSGPILYSQDRTTAFGRTFRLYKFRTMRPGSGDTTPIDDEQNSRITPVGRFLRRTHFDELPQLYSILIGDMSVVGPRAVWIEEEKRFLETSNGRWRKRWFVNPGLTGLAQINDVSSTNPELKLRYDTEYIRRQSFVLDTRIVVRQVLIVLRDLFSP